MKVGTAVGRLDEGREGVVTVGQIEIAAGTDDHGLHGRDALRGFLTHRELAGEGRRSFSVDAAVAVAAWIWPFASHQSSNFLLIVSFPSVYRPSL